MLSNARESIVDKLWHSQRCRSSKRIKQSYRSLPPWNDWPLEPLIVMTRKVMNFQRAFLSEHSAVQGQQCVLHTLCALLGIAGTLNENQILKANRCLNDAGKPNSFITRSDYLWSVTNWDSGSERVHRLGCLHCLLAWDETLASLFLKSNAETSKSERFSQSVSRREKIHNNAGPETITNWALFI